MKVLALNHQVFVLLWIFPSPDNKSILFKIRNIIFGLMALISVMTPFVTSIAYVFKYVSVDLENSLYALFQIAGYGCQIYLIIIGFILWSKFSRMFPILQQIYDDSK